ncbi:MAG: hypothetical protein KGI52_01860 [Burkholderiales bacterium]|nr:hypothetical protein [Burkholderiales bacterium]
MSLDTYDGLTASIGSWIKRSDLAANIPDFIRLAEARIARELRLRRQITTATIPTVGGVQSIDLPDDYLEAENITLQGSIPRQLTFVPIEHLDARYPADYTAMPAVYTMLGNQLLMGPVPDAIYNIEVVYYARFTPLSSSNQTNWLLQNHPGIYIFSALAEAEPFMMNDDRSVMWEGKAEREIEKLQSADDQAVHSGTALRVKTVN